jgi:rRNA-processing protein FCF1
MATVLVDAENIRRSVWPNLARDDLERRARSWGDEHGHDVIVVWEGAAESADDRIARLAEELPPTLWIVTSDRELRSRVADRAERLVGGGSFARQL